MTQTPQVRLTGKAARLLGIIQDLGHLDDDSIEQILLILGAQAERDGVVTADATALRRVAATVLFDRTGALGIDGILAEDWPILFS